MDGEYTALGMWSTVKSECDNEQEDLGMTGTAESGWRVGFMANTLLRGQGARRRAGGIATTLSRGGNCLGDVEHGEERVTRHDALGTRSTARSGRDSSYTAMGMKLRWG